MNKERKSKTRGRLAALTLAALLTLSLGGGATVWASGDSGGDKGAGSTVYGPGLSRILCF